jgi:hypothetical protein
VTATPIFVTCRDRVRYLRELVEWLEAAGHERIVLLDNDSSYEPLVDYLDASRHEVVRLGRNYGARALWDAGLAPSEPFVLTDPDLLPIAECPSDAIEHLAELLERHPKYPKAGLGLYLDDVPWTREGHEDWERSLVSRQIEPGAFDSLVDTTFALYRPDAPPNDLLAIRTGFPYQARHMSASWYPELHSAEDDYYLSRAIGGPQGSSWKGSL